MRYFEDILYTYISGEGGVSKGVCHVHECLFPPDCPFQLSSLNELYRGKLLRSITFIPFEKY